MKPNGLGLGEGDDFNTKFDTENQTLINHKCVCGELNRHFCQIRVIGSALLSVVKVTLRQSSHCQFF